MGEQKTGRRWSGEKSESGTNKVNAGQQNKGKGIIREGNRGGVEEVEEREVS